MKTFYTHFPSPIGSLLLISDGISLVGLHTSRDKYKPKQEPAWVEDASAIPFPETTRQLREYFEGARKTFNVPLAPHGTDFQVRVWKELCNIPCGETISYAELARRIGNANASRAVGMANSRNPISIIVPCHRVIGANGSLTGYAGGLDRKQALLAHEANASGTRDEVRGAREGRNLRLFA